MKIFGFVRPRVIRVLSPMESLYRGGTRLMGFESDQFYRGRRGDILSVFRPMTAGMYETTRDRQA